jgi:hypothetical protein
LKESRESLRYSLQRVSKARIKLFKSPTLLRRREEKRREEKRRETPTKKHIQF